MSGMARAKPPGPSGLGRTPNSHLMSAPEKQSPITGTATTQTPLILASTGKLDVTASSANQMLVDLFIVPWLHICAMNTIEILTALHHSHRHTM